MNEKTCIVIVGPTAVGKTSLSLQLAHHFQTSIISADSRQCFKELNIGVAKPAPDQLSSVQHYFINSHSITGEVNAAVFEAYALTAVNEIFSDKDIAIIVGGTGLYIKAFAEGLDLIPAISKEIRKDIMAKYELEGIGWLQEQLLAQDPDFLNTAESQNPQRLMRALEVKMSTGKSIRSFQTQIKKDRPFRLIKIGLELPRKELYDNINFRVDQMIEEGLIDEVKSLGPYEALNALQTVGYSEIFDFLKGKVEVDEAIMLIKKHTRHYAKRQITWFKKDQEITWFSPDDSTSLLNFLSGRISVTG
jgi:tRNA dimethylallyltransferase